MITRWYRTGVFYSVDVGLFQDSNANGVGDFQGLIARLDYLGPLGIATIWLNPIHPSPRQDGGYDISDYFSVHQQLGETAGDFEMLMHEAGERGIRVMVDLVGEPHQRPASLVPVGALRPALALPGLVCRIERLSRRTGSRAWCSPGVEKEMWS